MTIVNISTILKTLMVISLYIFMGWAIFTLWQELRMDRQQKNTARILPLVIEPVDTNGDIKVFQSPEVIIGRDAHCTYPVSVDSISKQHSRLSYHHNQWWVEDMTSTNGTFLNNIRVETPTVIISGDELRCGVTSFKITIQDL